MISIERSVFLQEYRKYAEKKMISQLGKMYNSSNEKRYKELSEWIEKDGNIRLDVYDPGFQMMKKVDLVPK